MNLLNDRARQLGFLSKSRNYNIDSSRRLEDLAAIVKLVIDTKEVTEKNILLAKAKSALLDLPPELQPFGEILINIYQQKL